MVTKILGVAFILLGVSLQSVFAQNATRTAVHQTPRFDIQDRIQYQMDRVKEGLADGTITPAHADYCLAALKVVENRLKNENISVNAMSQKEYNAYNHCLDANSSFIHESKQAFYYHDRTYSLLAAEFKI